MNRLLTNCAGWIFRKPACDIVSYRQPADTKLIYDVSPALLIFRRTSPAGTLPNARIHPVKCVALSSKPRIPLSAVSIRMTSHSRHRTYRSLLALRGLIFNRNVLGDTLRDALLRLCMELHPLEGPCAIVRVDPAPGFMAILEDKLLEHFRIKLNIGRVKNPNKNPVTHEQLPFADRDVISQKADSRDMNHVSSAMSKAQLKGPLPKAAIPVDDLVYLYSDRDKTKGLPR